MRPAEATSKDTSIVATPTSAVSSRRAGEGAQPFASVLQATRQSSQVLMRMLAPPQPGEAGRSRANKSREESSSRADHSRAEQAQSKDEDAEKSRRADRSRSNSQERAKTARSNAESGIESSVSNADSTPVAPQQLEYQVGGGATMEGESMPVATNIASLCDVNGSVTPVSDGQTSTANGMGATNAATGVQAATANNPGQPSGGLGSTGSTGVVPVAGSAATGEGSAGGKDGSATTSQDATITATARAAGATSRSGGNNEFQQLLNQLDRSRPAGLDRGEASTVATKFKVAADSTNKTVDLQSPGSVAELARIVRTQVGSRGSSMVLELSPAELGRVRVDVRMQDSNVAIQFGTETAAGQREIKNRLNELKGALEQQGITVDRVSVEMLPTAPSLAREQDLAGQQQPDGQHGDVPANGGRGGGQGAMPDSRNGGNGTAGEADTASWQPITEAIGDWTRTGVDVMV